MKRTDNRAQTDRQTDREQAASQCFCHNCKQSKSGGHATLTNSLIVSLLFCCSQSQPHLTVFFFFFLSFFGVTKCPTVLFCRENKNCPKLGRKVQRYFLTYFFIFLARYAPALISSIAYFQCPSSLRRNQGGLRTNRPWTSSALGPGKGLFRPCIYPAPKI